MKGKTTRKHNERDKAMGNVTIIDVMIIVAMLATLALVPIVVIWLQQRKRARVILAQESRKYWTNEITLHAVWQFLRAKFLAGGYDKHHAYHIAEDGRILVVDAVDFYLAVLAGMHDFWDAVSTARGFGRKARTVTLEEIDFGDGKGNYTFIDGYCGHSYIDDLLLDASDELPDSYGATRMTADEFKKAVVDAQREAAERGRGYDNIEN